MQIWAPIHKVMQGLYKGATDAPRSPNYSLYQHTKSNTCTMPITVTFSTHRSRRPLRAAEINQSLQHLHFVVTNQGAVRVQPAGSDKARVLALQAVTLCKWVEETRSLLPTLHQR